MRESLNQLDLVRAGDVLIFTENGSGTGGLGIRKPRPRIKFFTLDDPPRAMIEVEFQHGQTIPSVPIAVDNKLIIHLNREIICLAVAGEAGTRLDTIARANGLIQRVGLRPQVAEITDIAPTAALADHLGPEYPINPMRPKLSPQQWMVAGPWPKDLWAMPKELAAEWHQPQSGGLAIGESGHTLKPLNPEIMQLTGTKRIRHEGNINYAPDWGISLRKLFGKKKQYQAVLSTICRVSQPGAYQFLADGQGVSSWLGTTPIQHEQYLRLEAGYYQLVVLVDIRRLPPFGNPTVSPRFQSVKDPREIIQKWHENIRFDQQLLENLVADYPDLPVTSHAKRFLQAITQAP